jgi:hypothetical protein
MVYDINKTGSASWYGTSINKRVIDVYTIKNIETTPGRVAGTLEAG